MTVPGQSVVNYTFDNANRLTQITQGSTTVSFSYDNANRPTTLTLPNGITTSYSYDNASQLTGLTYAKGSNTLGSLTYGYDLNGRRPKSPDGGEQWWWPKGGRPSPKGVLPWLPGNTWGRKPAN